MGKMRWILCLVGLISGIGAPAWGQQVVPSGGEILINTTTTGEQESPSLAVHPTTGDYLVVWAERQDGGFLNGEIRGQRFLSDGSGVGGELLVNSYTPDNQRFPSASIAADGSFVIAWQGYSSTGSDTGDYSIQMRRFDSAGSPLGTDIQVNSEAPGYQRHPVVGHGGNGDFVVVWGSQLSSGDTDGYSVQGQRFASDGSRLGGQFQANAYTTGSQGGLGKGQSVAVAGDGSFVVTWASSPTSGDYADTISGRLFDSAGVPVAGDFAISTDPSYRQSTPAVDMAADGSFMVVWSSGTVSAPGHDGDGVGLRIRRFDSAGTPLAAEMTVNSYTTGNQFVPTVAQAANGSFVVVWGASTSAGSDPDFNVQARRFDSSGQPLADDFQVNSFTESRQFAPQPRSVGFLDDQQFVVIWQSGNSGAAGPDGDSSGVVGQRYATPLFADGFESADTGAWSATLQ